MSNLDMDTSSNQFRSPRGEHGWLAIGCMIAAVAGIYIVAGLGFGITAQLNSTDWLGDNGTLITDPRQKERIDNLSFLALVLWILGGLAIGVGWYTLSQNAYLSSVRKRWTIAAMFAFPVIWLLTSIWVIGETNDAVDASRTPRATVAPKVTWSVSTIQPGATPVPVIGVEVPGDLEYTGARFDQINFAVTADVPVSMIVSNSSSDDLLVTLSYLNVTFTVPNHTTVVLTVTLPPGNWPVVFLPISSPLFTAAMLYAS